MNESIQFLRNYCDFSNPNWVWMLKGISRNKDNETKSGFFRRLILTSTDDIEPCYAEMHTLANNPDTNYRLYVSLNSRDVVKALFNFQRKMLDIGYGLARGLEDHLSMSKKVGSIWKTELEQNSCRGTKRFLLDIDDSDELVSASVASFLEIKCNIPVLLNRKTVSGYHIVFDACDTREVMKFCEGNSINADLQRDSMVFVERWRYGEN